MSFCKLIKLKFNRKDKSVKDKLDNHRDELNNDTLPDADKFRLYDDFTTDLRIYNIISNSYSSVATEFKKKAKDSSVDAENGNTDESPDSNCSELLDEVMVWSSMESTTSPSDSGPSPCEEPSTSTELTSADSTHDTDKTKDKPRPKDLDLESRSKRPHFLDEDYKTNIEYKIKPHFLDHAPSPDDEKSDITNPNFLDEILAEDDSSNATGALPKKTTKPADERPKPSYKSAFHYGLEAARTTERNKRTSQLYQGTWPGERDVWSGNDTASVRSYSSNGSAEAARPSSKLENKMECVYSLLSLLTLSPDNNADLSGSLLEMSRSVESCVAMRQAGCIPLLVQLIHSKLPRETRDRAAKALRNIIHTQTDDKAGRRESRVWRLLEQVREYCYSLEDLVEAKKDGKELVDDVTKHPSQSVAALMKLSFDEEHRHVVCQLGGLQALAALVSNDQAAHGSRTDDNTCLTMRKYAGMTLTNLTFGDGNNKSLLCSFKDFMMALVEQLESPNDDMRQVTAAVLRNLSWRADTNSKQVLREVGAVKGLTKAAMTCQKEATLKSVLSALWNLTAHCSMNKVALCSVDGALGFLVDMLSYNSPTKTLAIVENAGGIMRNVSSHIAVKEEYRQILRERNCLSVLLQHLKSPSLTVVSNSCGTLWNLSARCPQDQQFLWDNGAVPMLRSLIHSKHKMIAMGSGAALKNLINSKPGKTHIVALDSTARSMNLPTLPTLGVRKQKALEQELDNNLAETCDNIEPATSPSTSNREEKNLERQIAMNLERHRMSSSSPMMGSLTSQISLSHSAHLASYLSCSNTLLKGALTTRSSNNSPNNVNRSDSKDSVASAQSDTVFEKVARSGKVPIPTPRSKDLVKADLSSEAFKTKTKEYQTPPVPPPRSSTEIRTYTESGYDVDQDSCDQPIDFSVKYSETKPEAEAKKEIKKKKENPNYGDYQETDLDQPTDYSLRYAEHHSETGSDVSEPGPSVDEDTIKHFATEGTPYETPIIFSTATSMSDLRIIGKDGKPKASNIKENTEIMTHSDEKDTCSIEDPPKHDNDKAVPEKQFDTKFSSGMISPEKPVNYCDEGTPGYFSRVSSLSSLGEPTEEDCLAKKNAMASINVEVDALDQNAQGSKDKEGSKAVTFACDGAVSSTATPGARTPAFIEDTPLMFSRTSSLGSIPDCDQNEEVASVVSEISRMPSGLLSPCELPESPCGVSAPLSAPLTAAHSPTPHDDAPSVFSERATTFLVENTPAHFSINTSLSSLTIDDEPKTTVDNIVEEPIEPRLDESDYLLNNTHETSHERSPQACDNVPETTPKEVCSDRDESSDSSNLSDSADLLQECIQKGIDKVVKNKGPPSEAGSVTQYVQRDGPYLSLPSYLRSSTETVKMTHDYPLNGRNSGAPPPLPPRGAAPPPRPPPLGAKHESRLPIKTSTQREKPKLPTTNLIRNDSLSSLSIDSFGSTDREIFEETVKAGLPRKDKKPNERIDVSKRQYHKSLDRSDKIQHKNRYKDPEFERNLASGAYNLKTNLKIKRIESEFIGLGMTRTPYSFHGDTTNSLVHRSRGHTSRYFEDGPPSLPIKVEPQRLERSNSLSSLSNDSFGSTDKEVFERCVRIGMNRQIKKKDDPRMRVRSDDRLESRDVRDSHRSRRRKENRGALDKMVGEEYSKDRAILEEMIARGAGEKIEKERDKERPKNVTAPSVVIADADGHADRDKDMTTGSELRASQQTIDNASPKLESTELQSPKLQSNTLTSPQQQSTKLTSPNDTSINEINHMDISNECLAQNSALDSTLDSETKDELNRSNESYADFLNETLSDIGSPPKDYDAATLTRKKPQWTDIKAKEIPEFDMAASRLSNDTWNDNTCLDDVTFPTISGSIHLISSLRSEDTDGLNALPDLLEKSGIGTFSRPDLTSKLDALSTERSQDAKLLFESITEPSLVSLTEGTEHLDSILRTEIQKESARLAAQLRNDMANSATSLTSLDLNNVKPPSEFGSLVSLSNSGVWDDSKKTNNKNSRKKSLPVAIMVKRALSNSYNQGSSEQLDNSPNSYLLENVKPPSEMENIDMESSIISVSSIASDVEVRNKTPVVFDLKQPIQEFPLCNNLNLFHDLENVNPPSLFEELVESEIEQTTAQNMYEDCVSTLNVVTDIPSGSENCSPLPSDVSSVESTPKKLSKHLTPKEKRIISKDRYQTYTIADTVSQEDVTLHMDSEYLTWTKSESDSRSDDYVTAASEPKNRKKSAKQRRIDDRARYQTQTVDIHTIVNESKESVVDPELENLKQRLAAKKTLRQRRQEDTDRFRTRTLSEDIPPSPTYVSRDVNFENLETTTGYDSLSSNEPNHQQISEERTDEYPRDTDSGNNDDELENTQMLTYTRTFTHLPIVESPTSIELCLVNNLKNIEMTASYRRALQLDFRNPSSSDFASYEGDSNHSDSEPSTPVRTAKPKIIKPGTRDASLDSNESQDNEPKAIRGKKKALYVSPYRRNITPKKPTAKPVITSPATKPQVKNKAPLTRPTSLTSSPKKIAKVVQRPSTVPAKPLPLERQGTFVKEESTVLKEAAKVAPIKPNNTSPSRLPQLKNTRPQIKKTTSTDKTPQRPKQTMKNSASNHSLQSNDSTKTVTLASKNSGQGSSSSINSASSKPNTRDVESKIANLWKKVEQSKKTQTKPDKRVWIGSEKEPPKLIRSSTFEGQPKQQTTAPKQKTTIGIKVSQIPSPKTITKKPVTQIPTTSSNLKRPTNTRMFARKQMNGQTAV